MIEVYDQNVEERLQVIDHIVFAQGDIGNPVVTKILQIDEHNETKLDEIRRDVYETERAGIQRQTEGIFTLHSAADFKGNVASQRNVSTGKRHNNRLNTQRSRSEIKANPITRTKINEDENTVTYTYKNGETVTEKFSSPEEAKASGKVSDAKFSIEFADDIANKQRQFAADGLSRISSEELEKAIADTAHMVNEMKPYYAINL
jgi:hypothetical protein